MYQVLGDALRIFRFLKGCRFGGYTPGSGILAVALTVLAG